MRILVISSVLPSHELGGELVMFRHLTRALSSPEIFHFSVLLTNEDVSSKVAGSPLILEKRNLFGRLKDTRLSGVAHSWADLGLDVSRRAITRLVKKEAPDVILSVAHGELFPQAVKVSKRLGIPLVLVYHDWWPDISLSYPIVRKFLQRLFIRSASYAEVCLCVSDGMQKALGSPVNSKILLPLSGGGEPSTNIAPASSHIRLAYSGNLNGSYGKMILDLEQEIRAALSGEVTFSYSGSKPEGLDEFSDVGYLGMLELNELKDFWNQNDILLVVMSFSKREARRMRTSFPSKLIEYSRLGMPIIIWGPGYCSAVQWSKTRGAGIIVSEPAATAVVDVLKQICKDSASLSSCVEGIRLAARDDFDEGCIQASFEAALLNSRISHEHN